jgi:histidinol-phosphate/aromatic aminotransferase/cobyric acid decarboxylase-like protein
MALAISSYETLPVLGDSEGVLNLAWTLDERAFLAVDPAAVIARELAQEVGERLPFVNSYFVQDPYGENVLGPAVAAFFAQEGWPCRVTCGAGANSLLHALARLAQAGSAFMVGDVYPDFPCWIERCGGECRSRAGWRGVDDLLAELESPPPAVVLVERPALVGRELALSELAELCTVATRRDIVVLVDESHGNYLPPAWSAVRLVVDHPSLVVLRGLSKAYSQGGLRLGYCVTSAAMAERLRAMIPPLLVSSLSLRLGRAILALGDIMGPLRARVLTARMEMATALEPLGLQAAETCDQVPYVFYRDEDHEVQRSLESRGILGKQQPFWMEDDRSVGRLYRLSVPLRPERLEILRRKAIGPCVGGASR